MDKTLRQLLPEGDFVGVDPKRSDIMRAIRSKDTKPEMVVRSLVHRMGYRFRLHRRDLPGSPDIVLPRHNKIVQVYGCFWHMHACPLGTRSPRTNSQYWKAKRERNRERDARNRRELIRLGWQVLTVWECETKPQGFDRLVKRIKRFLVE